MNDTVVLKLKKYILFISFFLFFFLGAHLMYLYLFDGAKSEAQVGGTISEAIIGSFPHLNPLVPSNDHNNYINGLLYRSLLQYSTKTGTIESDLASCNLENLLYIECVLEGNLEWSNSTPISPVDIESTLNIIRETKVNPILASLLENTQIEVRENTIIFKNSSKDVNFLQVLLQPILPKSIVETLDSENIDGKFSENGVYSGRFILTSISLDETVGVTKITLGKNEKYFGNTLYIQFLILNLFRDEEHFLKNKSSFNIFNDKDALIGDSIPRLQVFEYTLSQFVGTFLNTETLPKEMRVFLSNIIDREAISEYIGKAKVLPAYNPFLSKTSLDPEAGKFKLSTFLETKGYYSKKELLKSALALKNNLSEKQISSEVVPVVPEKKVIQQATLSYISSPNNKKYNFSSEDNILVQGKVEAGVDGVYINDYKLSGFKKGDDIFSYRLLESYDSIKIGENTYKLYFETKSEKKLIEEFVYIYETESEKLATLEKNFFTKVEDIPQQIPNTPSIKQEIVAIPTQLSLEEIQKLDDTFVYDARGKKYELQLVYTQGDAGVEASALLIQKQLAAVGISLTISAISLGDISVGLRNESLKYDMLLIGVNLGYFGTNIFPYFHSSQVKNGYNFSNLKKLSLDILLEELTSNMLSLTKKQELEGKMIDILREEAIVKILYTPKIQLLVDKNIKNFVLPNYLPDGKHRFFPLIDAYLSEKKSIQQEGKGFFDFVVYIFKIMFS